MCILRINYTRKLEIEQSSNIKDYIEIKNTRIDYKMTIYSIIIYGTPVRVRQMQRFWLRSKLTQDTTSRKKSGHNKFFLWIFLFLQE